ncbi:MAG: transglutaminase-like domain-containing protein [Merdibacter sp.]
MHYATAATLMMRYYGYPARYVEGYRITAGDFTDDHAYVRDHHAHAWVEVYDEVLGWIPLEFTESAPAQETAPGEESDAPTLNDPSSDVPDVQPAEDPSLPDPQPQQPSDPSASAISIGWLIAIAVFLFIGLTQLLRHHRKMRRCHRADANAGRTCLLAVAAADAGRRHHTGSSGRAHRPARRAFQRQGHTRAAEQMLKLLQQAQKDLRSLPVIRRIRLFLSDAIW